MNFREMGEGSLQSEKFVAKKRNIVFRNKGGGVKGCLDFFQKFIQIWEHRPPLKAEWQIIPGR